MPELKEAMFYEKLPDNKVKCTLCPWFCKIAQGKVGICGVRQNIEGKLYSLIYAKVSSVAADPIEKKPLFHFYPGTKVLSLGTFGCNMRCGHCQNWQIAHVKLGQAKDPQLEYLPPENLVELAKQNNCQGIAWTYNEPIVWFEYSYEGAKLAKAAGLYTVWVTNGYVTFEALDTIAPYLDAFRVDVKGFNQDFYTKLAKIRDFKPVLEAAERAKKKWDMHVEIVTNIIPTMNDDEAQLKGIADWIVKKLGPETPWHVTRFMPYLEYSHLPPTPISTLEKARQIGLDAGLQFVYLGNVPGHKAENTYCPKCSKLLIKRVGYQTDLKNVAAGKCGFCGQDLGFRC
ncbi:MAG: AmmeMemoRadiSam system radical SAM enzyme [Candidatus Margulisbacteria bacterium]|nr:AmmeMemoRadiSam system radical SAM enzyme [Candidatus Margulisiibacteriota bacterium]